MGTRLFILCDSKMSNPYFVWQNFGSNFSFREYINNVFLRPHVPGLSCICLCINQQEMALNWSKFWFDFKRQIAVSILHPEFFKFLIRNVRCFGNIVFCSISDFSKVRIIHFFLSFLVSFRSLATYCWETCPVYYGRDFRLCSLFSVAYRWNYSFRIFTSGWLLIRTAF